MTLLQMQYLYETCRCQNITKAAGILHITQPTLSIAIHNIEQETGLNLFRHVGRNIQMTPDGIRLFAQISSLLDHVHNVSECIKDMSHRRNYVQLAVPSQVGVSMLPLLLGEFRQLHPEIRLEIAEPSGIEAAEMVKNEDVDAAIIHYEIQLDGLDYQKILSIPICLYVRPDHPLARRKRLTLSEAAQEKLVLLDRNFFMTRILQERFKQAGLQPEILHCSPHLSSLWNIVQHGIAAAIITANAAMPGSNCVTIPIEGLSMQFCIITKKGRQIYEDERCLIQFIKDHFANQPTPIKKAR